MSMSWQDISSLCRTTGLGTESVSLVRERYVPRFIKARDRVLKLSIATCCNSRFRISIRILSWSLYRTCLGRATPQGKPSHSRTAPRSTSRNLVSHPTLPDARLACCHETTMSRSHLLIASTNVPTILGSSLQKGSRRPFAPQ